MNGKVKIFFRLEIVDDYPPAGIETMWATCEGSEFRLDNVPFFAERIACGDLVKATKDADGCLYFDEVVEMSGNGTLHLFVMDLDNVQQLRSQVETMGCSSELGLPRLIAVNVPKNIDYPRLRSFLMDKETAGELSFSESCLPGS
jgi:hypothetical protein